MAGRLWESKTWGHMASFLAQSRSPRGVGCQRAAASGRCLEKHPHEAPLRLSSNLPGGAILVSPRPAPHSPGPELPPTPPSGSTWPVWSSGCSFYMRRRSFTGNLPRKCRGRGPGGGGGVGEGAAAALLLRCSRAPLICPPHPQGPEVG